MQKILYFEVATAIKDRPRAFRLITILLIAFSLTVIVVSTITRLTEVSAVVHVSKEQAVNRSAGTVSSPALAGMQK